MAFQSSQYYQIIILYWTNLAVGFVPESTQFHIHLVHTVQGIVLDAPLLVIITVMEKFSEKEKRCIAENWKTWPVAGRGGSRL